MHHARRYFMLVVVLILFLICGVFGCSKTDDPEKKGSQTPTTEMEAGKTGDLEQLKQIYVVFMDGFQMESFKSDNEGFLSSNQAVVSETISEIEGIRDNIKEVKTQEICDKFLGLLGEYHDAAATLERAAEETKRGREELDRREEEAKAKASAPQERWNSFSEQIKIREERSQLSDYRNLGVKQEKVKEIETSLYWLHKEFRLEGFLVKGDSFLNRKPVSE